MQIENSLCESDNHYEISESELDSIKNLEIKRACILLYRLAPKPFTFANHFGLVIELQNGNHYMIHNSPSNKG